MKKLVLIGIAAALGAALPARAQDHIAIALDASQTGPRIDRHVFGQFAEDLGRGVYEGIWVGPDSPIPNVRGIRKDVVEALKAIHVPVVRWPGGCFADEYHWRDGIGPSRAPTPNVNWGGVMSSNAFGSHEFMDFVEQIGSEAYISVNMGSGTVKEAADWIAYLTGDPQSGLGRERAANGHPEPYKVAYLGLGNESWGCGGAMTPAEYVQQMKLYARFVRSFNNRQAMDKVAVGPDGGNIEYTEAVMQAWQKRGWPWDIQGLSMHAYTIGGWPPAWKSTGFGEKDYAVAIKGALDMDSLVTKQSAIMDKYDPDKKVSLVVDEWGAWLAPNPGSNPGFLEQENSQRDAVLAALHLNIFARHADRVRMTNIAQMVNVLQAMILTKGEKIVLTPTYHVFRLYAPFQDATFIPLSFDRAHYASSSGDLPRIDAIAARAKDGKILVALTNIDATRPVSIDINMLGVNGSGAVGSLLSAPAVDSINSFDAPQTVTPRAIAIGKKGDKLNLDLPPHSVAVVTLN